MADTTCCICFDDLYDTEGQLVSAFDEDIEEDTDISTTVFRLKCGHAFHTACIVRSLRLGRSCPSCRDEHAAVQTSAQNPLATAIQTSLQQLFDAHDMQQPVQLVETNVQGLASITQSVMTMNRLRETTPRLQRIRARFNKSRKAYLRLETQLVAQRSQTIQQALETFRSNHQTSFYSALRAMRRELRRVKIAELDILRSSVSPETYGPIAQDLLEYEYDISRFTNRRSFDAVAEPTDRRFWGR